MSFPENYPSLCIPRVFPDIPKEYIEHTFKQFGILSHLEMLLKTSARGEKFYLVFVHYKSWYLDTYTYATRLKLIRGENIQVYYNHKYFWKVSAMRLTKPLNPTPPPKPTYCKPPLPLSPPPIKSLRIELPSLSSLSLGDEATDSPCSPCSPPPIARPKAYSPISPLSPPPSSPTSSYSSISYKQPEQEEEEEPLEYEKCAIDYKNAPYPKRRRPARVIKAA
jgi:hypothetical protein